MPKSGEENTYARLQGWYMDAPGKHNTLGENTGGLERAKWIAESKIFELRGRPCLDLFECERLLIPGADMQLTFQLNDPKFFLQGAADAANHKLVIQEAELYVRRVTIGESFVAGITNDIKQTDAIYPFTRREIMSFNIATGMTQMTQENVFWGQLAVNYYVCMVDSEAYSGSITKNPFYFQDFKLSEIGLYINGQSVSQQPLKVNFSDDNTRIANAYHLFLESNGAISERACYLPIDYEAFKKDLQSSPLHVHLISASTVLHCQNKR